MTTICPTMPQRPTNHQSDDAVRVVTILHYLLTKLVHLLPPILHPNLQGIIKISPPLIWHSLNPEHRNWVLSYNAAVRHDEKPPLPPDGITVSYYKDDGNGNKGVPCNRSRTPTNVTTDLTSRLHLLGHNAVPLIGSPSITIQQN